MTLGEIRRPQTAVVLAMSADGKIADIAYSSPNFGSSTEDYVFLEQQVAAADAVLAGATTLRAGGTAMRVQNPDLIADRLRRGKPEQPAQIVCSRSGQIDPTLKFFKQAVPHWLVTGAMGAEPWQDKTHFEQIFVHETPDHQLDWLKVFQDLGDLGIETIAVLGGGEVVASLLAAHLIDELFLTVCPLLLGGAAAPTPVGGKGWLQQEAPHLNLISVRQVNHEVFLHYRCSW